MMKAIQKRFAILTASLSLFIATPCIAQSQQTLIIPKVQTSAKPEQTTVYKSKESQKGQQTTAAKVSDKRNEKPNSKTVKTEKLAKESRKPKTEINSKRYTALKSNIAYDAFAVFNLAFEMQVHNRITVELPVMWSLWDLEQAHGIRTVALQPEARWWTGSEVGEGHFFGLHAHVAWFNVKWENNRYQDTNRPLLGAGLSYGYKLPLNDHWGAEFCLGLGYANMKYNTYYNIDNGAKIDTRIRHYWGITRVGASLVYRF